MVVHKIAIYNIYEIIKEPMKIWHSCRGKILTAEKQNDNLVVYYENEPMADQEFYSYIVGVETGKEVCAIAGREPKYLRTLMFDNDSYVLHIYTNT